MSIDTKGNLYWGVEAALLLTVSLWLGSTLAKHSAPATGRAVASASSAQPAISRVVPPTETSSAIVVQKAEATGRDNGRSSDSVQVFTAFKEDEWVEVPTALFGVSEGFDALLLLNTPPEEATDTLGSMKSTLKLSPQESATVANLLYRFASQWCQLQAASVKKEDATTWSLTADPTRLKDLAVQMNQSIRKAIGDERAYVFRCLSEKGLQFMVSQSEMRIQFVNEGTSVRIGGPGNSGLLIGLRDVTAKAPLNSILNRLK